MREGSARPRAPRSPRSSKKSPAGGAGVSRVFPIRSKCGLPRPDPGWGAIGTHFPMCPLEHDRARAPSPPPSSPPGTPHGDDESSLPRALAQGLDTPLAALRATMESLGQELQLEHGAVKPLRIDGVLREVDRLGKNVRELCEFATPPVPRPLRCSLEEIVAAARAPLAPEQRARVIVARSEPGPDIDVDGPLLSGCLRRLLEN